MPREPRWADPSIEANVLELGSNVEIAELPDDVIMVSSLQGGKWRLNDVFFDLDEAIDVAIDLYGATERRGEFAANRAPVQGRASFATRVTEARRARQRSNGSSKAPKAQRRETRARAPSRPEPKPKFQLGDYVRDKESRGWEGVVSYIGDYDQALRGFRYKVTQQDGVRTTWNERSMVKATPPALYMADDFSSPFTLGEFIHATSGEGVTHSSYARMSALEPGQHTRAAGRLVRRVDGAPQHRNSGPVVKRDVEKTFGPSGYPPHRVLVRAGLRVVPITEGRTRGKFWLDEFPDEEFKPGSTIRHDAVHYGVVLEPEEVTR